MTIDQLVEQTEVTTLINEYEEYRNVVKCETIATYGDKSYKVCLFASSVHYNENSALALFIENLKRFFVQKLKLSETLLWVEKIS